MSRSRPLLLTSVLAILVPLGCSASPEEVCGHIHQLVEDEASEEVAELAVDGCEFKWKMRQDTKGLFHYRELASCVMDAQSVADLTECK